MRGEDASHELHENQLQDDRDDEDNPKHGVAVHVLEHVALVVDATRIDLVEHLHEHEHVEHHGELDLRIGALAQIRSDRDIKETVAIEHDGQQNHQVEQQMEKQVSQNDFLD